MTTTERSSDSTRITRRLTGDRLLDGVVARLRRASTTSGRTACIGTILVSEDARERANMYRKHRKAEEAGMRFRHVALTERATQAEVEDAVAHVARDEGVHGIFVQLPLPRHLDVAAVLSRIPPAKDIDPVEAPATPAGIIELLRLYEIPIERRSAVVVANAPETARPLLAAFAQAGASPLELVDPDAGDVRTFARDAEILIAAAGRAHLIGRDFVKPGATVVDTSSNRTPGGVIGDVDTQAIEGIAGAVVPMPGGAGPATIAMLLERTWNAAH